MTYFLHFSQTVPGVLGVIIFYLVRDHSLNFTTLYRRASGADPGLADLQLAAEEQEEVAGQCAAEAGGKRFSYNLVLKKLLGWLLTILCIWSVWSRRVASVMTTSKYIWPTCNKCLPNCPFLYLVDLVGPQVCGEEHEHSMAARSLPGTAYSEAGKVSWFVWK